MPLLREVWIWPPSGFVDKPWGHHDVIDDGPDADPFLRQSRAICDRYCDALPGLKITHRTSHLRLSLASADDDRLPTAGDEDPPTVLFIEGVREGFEMGAIRIPTGWRHRPREQRQEDILEALHAATTLMAEARSLTGRERLPQAVEHVRSHGYGYTWDGPWARAPRRGPHRARLRFRTAEDGFGRARLEVEALDDAGRPVASSMTEEHLCWTSGTGGRRSARTLRWAGPDLLSVELGPFGHGEFGADRTLLVAVSAGPGHAPALVESVGAPLPERRRPSAAERAVAVDIPADADAQRRLATSKKVTDRLAAALDGRTAPDVIETLTADSSVKVGEAVARRATAPADLLARLAGDPDRRVREAVATNAATPADTVVLLAADAA